MKGWTVIPVDGVEITYQWDGWEVFASWPQRGSRHEIVSLLRVRYTGMEPRLVMSTKRINLLSSSAVNSIIMSMRKAVPSDDDLRYADLIHAVCEDLIGWYQQGKGISRPDPSKARSNGGWLLYPIWPATGATAVAAAPGSYKSFMAQAIALSVSTQATVLNRNTTLRHHAEVLYLDWEADEGTFAERLAAMCRGAGLEEQPHLGYKQMTARLSDVAISLSEEIMRHKYQAVVIDSMSAAIGAGMVDDDAVNGFWDGVRSLGVPALVLAHKSADSINQRRKRFFGSIMSEARVRMAWNGEKAEDGSAVKWQCFKDNNTGHIGNELAWELDFETIGERDERQLDRISFLGVNPKNVLLDPEEPSGRGDEGTVADMIEALLHEVGAGMTPAGIGSRLNKSSANVRAQLSRHTERFAQDKNGRWWPRVPGGKNPAQADLPVPY
jgi:hypothetical protein